MWFLIRLWNYRINTAQSNDRKNKMSRRALFFQLGAVKKYFFNVSLQHSRHLRAFEWNNAFPFSMWTWAVEAVDRRAVCLTHAAMSQCGLWKRWSMFCTLEKSFWFRKAFVAFIPNWKLVAFVHVIESFSRLSINIIFSVHGAGHKRNSFQINWKSSVKWSQKSKIFMKK